MNKGLVNIQQRPDPFSEVYTALVDNIVQEPRFAELVKPKNIWRMDRSDDNLGPWNKQDSDMPSVMFVPAGMASVPTASSTSGQHQIQLNVMVATPLTDCRLMFAVYYAIVEAVNREDLTPAGAKYSRLAVTTDLQAAVADMQNEEIVPGKNAWSCVIPLTAEFWIDRNLSSQGGY